MSNNLGRTTVAQGQGSDVFTAINDADEVFDRAISGFVDIIVDSSNAVTVAAADWKFATLRLIEGSPSPSAAAVITVPATVRGLVTIINALSFDASISISGQTEPAPSVRPGGVIIVNSDGVDVRGGAGSSYDVPLQFSGTPTSSQVLSAFVMVRPVEFPANFAGSRGHVGTLPTASFTISVRKNGAQIGQIAIGAGSPGGGDFSFSTTAGAVVRCVAGDLLEFIAPAGVDATIAYILCTLLGIA